MAEIAETLFWISFCMLMYTYLGYPIILIIIVFINKAISGKKQLTASETSKTVSLIVTAYNEEKIIEGKIRNSLELDYPSFLLKIIFITDGSDDDTPAIIQRFPGIQLLHQSARNGKLAAMNRAMQFVTTEYVVFSDANSFLNSDSIKNMLSRYSDHKVGGVTGEKRIAVHHADGTVAHGEGLYWKYESFLKKMDAELYTVVGAAGELFSMRTDLYVPLDESIILEDFVQSLLLCANGYVVKYEPRAFAEERASLNASDEMERKIRISAGAFQAIGLLKRLLDPFRFPRVSFQFISHRILRWTLCPVSLVVLLVTSLVLYSYYGAYFYAIVVVAQVVFYFAAIIGWYLAIHKSTSKLFYLPFYFLFMNFCVFAGFVRYLGKKQNPTWKKAERV